METVPADGPKHMAGPVYLRAREGAMRETPMELRRLCRQFYRWRDGGPLEPEVAEALRAVEDELRSRGQELPT